MEKKDKNNKVSYKNLGQYKQGLGLISGLGLPIDLSFKIGDASHEMDKSMESHAVALKNLNEKYKPFTNPDGSFKDTEEAKNEMVKYNKEKDTLNEKEIEFKLPSFKLSEFKIKIYGHEGKEEDLQIPSLFFKLIRDLIEKP